ncbi:RIP metalloprotease RseP [Alkaliphilus serpentinus]|uniref:Zinc metalloprotease n=1 Tax=Alkaliphilus serpentinus TaxID=1482731 RepID=A0A833HPZ0_9FIRM|nr:RIP metalloprotease RseP [Alkaliphilus serpentinus]KAB3531345.1 RIP metalloprotease RseP [Alkaliphilus serpentinus]
MQTIIVALAVFGVLVIFHELGHFCVAKATGIKVHEFAIGMGPRIFHHKGKETEYSLRALPIGGYVKMEGEDEASEDARSFSKKSIPVRMAVLFAGSFMNIVLAIILFTIIFFSLGAATNTVGDVVIGSPAESAGLQPGDTITQIDSEKIYTWNQLVERIMESNGDPLEIQIKRGEEIFQKTVTPKLNEETNRFTIGIETKVERSIGQSIKTAVLSAYEVMKQIVGFLRQLITRQADADQLTGPVGIIAVVGQASKSGWQDVVSLAGLISINLGIMNLLPIPALDGSRIMFLFVELLRGKPVDPEKEGMIHLVGFGLLIMLMLFVTWQDILRLVQG